VTYAAILYASALEPVNADLDVSTGDLDRPRRSTAGAHEDECRVYSHTRVRSDEFDRTFSTQSEFRAYLREHVDTGDLGAPKVRRVESV